MPKLFMILTGCKPPGRHTEQHDVFFGIADTLQELYPKIKAFWPQGKVHVDAWREVTSIEGYQVNIVSKESISNDASNTNKLFFINLGGYQPDKFEEQHYIVLTVKPDKGAASKEAKSTLFYRHNHFEGATSHIDDKYGIDVDDLYQIEELLTASQKQQYRIELVPSSHLNEDALHLGYLKLPLEKL